MVDTLHGGELSKEKVHNCYIKMMQLELKKFTCKEENKLPPKGGDSKNGRKKNGT